MGTIDINSSEYPSLLKEIDDPPPLLHFRGEWNQLLFERNLAVAGSRRMTRYGEAVLRRILKPLLAGGIVPVAGMMDGIDRQTHILAAECGKSSAVLLAGGIGWNYSDESEAVIRMVQESGGLVVSPYGGCEPPSLGGFHRRNRVISGLSSALLVVEAGKSSGALHTARTAFRQKRDVYAIPGPLTSSLSLGTAALIQKGAHIVTGPEDLSGFFGLYARVEEDDNERANLSADQIRIIEHLSREELSADELTRLTGRPVRETVAELSTLCLRNIISFSGGKYHKGICYAD